MAMPIHIFPIKWTQKVSEIYTYLFIDISVSKNHHSRNQNVILVHKPVAGNMVATSTFYLQFVLWLK